MTETISTLRSPRAAAVAGIIFAALSYTAMYMVQDIITTPPAEISQEWLEGHASHSSFAIALIPFVGISFLWFTGVLRDWVDDKEDRFFSTIFFGSGILIVGMLFIWAAAFGAMFNTYLAAKGGVIDRDIYVFGHAFLREILGDFALRMMGVYMTAIATIWRHTKVMPRWILVVTYVFAAAFIIFAAKVPEARFVFPSWVLLVSIYILINNLRSKKSCDQG